MTQKAKATYYYKLFRVKRSDGRVTTVSVDPVLVTRACQLMGGLRPVGQLVRATAFSYEDGMSKNCSGFVAQKLRDSVNEAIQARRNSAAALATA
jgi:hypothetical protein